MSHDALRENETAVSLPPPADATLRFIGRVRTPYPTRDDCPRQARPEGPECRLELDPIWEPALAGLEKFGRIEVLYWLDRSRRDLVTQSPRRNGQTVGTFALRSPVRPNPIGTALVDLVRIEGANVIVRSLDCIDGTPLVDIKPDRCSFSPEVAPKPADQRE